jgi:hypothetical protein
MKRLIGGSTALCIALAGMAGCARPGSFNASPGGSAAPVTAKYGGPAWQPAPAGPGEVVYAGAGIRTVAAPAGAVAAVDAAGAVAAVEAEHFPWTIGTPDVELRMVTTGDFAPGSNAVEATQLAWVVTYANTPIALLGGPYRADASSGVYPHVTASAAPSQNDCTFTMIVSAQTGDGVASFQHCPAA